MIVVTKKVRKAAPPKKVVVKKKKKKVKRVIVEATGEQEGDELNQFDEMNVVDGEEEGSSEEYDAEIEVPGDEEDEE